MTYFYYVRRKKEKMVESILTRHILEYDGGVKVQKGSAEKLHANYCCLEGTKKIIGCNEDPTVSIDFCTMVLPLQLISELNPQPNK